MAFGIGKPFSDEMLALLQREKERKDRSAGSYGFRHSEKYTPPDTSLQETQLRIGQADRELKVRERALDAENQQRGEHNSFLQAQLGTEMAGKDADRALRERELDEVKITGVENRKRYDQARIDQQAENETGRNTRAGADLDFRKENAKVQWKEREARIGNLVSQVADREGRAALAQRKQSFYEGVQQAKGAAELYRIAGDLVEEWLRPVQLGSVRDPAAIAAQDAMFDDLIKKADEFGAGQQLAEFVLRKKQSQVGGEMKAGGAAPVSGGSKNPFGADDPNADTLEQMKKLIQQRKNQVAPPDPGLR